MTFLFNFYAKQRRLKRYKKKWRGKQSGRGSMFPSTARLEQASLAS